MLISLRWLRFQDKMIQNASYLCRFFSFSVAGNSPKESVLGIAIRLLWQNVSKKRVSVQSTHCRKCAVGCIIEEISWATMLRDLIAFIGNHLNNGTKKKGGAFTVWHQIGNILGAFRFPLCTGVKENAIAIDGCKGAGRSGFPVRSHLPCGNTRRCMQRNASCAGRKWPCTKQFFMMSLLLLSCACERMRSI